jgi:hypothetical protein
MQLRIERKARIRSTSLTKRNLVLCPVVKLRGARRFVAGHLLGVLEPSVVLQVNRDAGCPPGMASYGRKKAITWIGAISAPFSFALGCDLSVRH